ncbi:MAG TPA: oxidoreductase [Roseiflexaceae bacterium]|nr:oxidoreductase [Roseiflexaceae bacterium]
METPIRVGLVGYGFAGRTFHAPLIAATPGLQLAAVATSGPERARADWPEADTVPTSEALLARGDIDLAVIATPNHTHAPLACAALDAGVHVVVDKPFTITVEEARELEARAMRAGRLLSVFHNRRWDSDFLTLRRLVEVGELGELALVESRFDRYRPEVRQRWREQSGPGSGLWYDLGPHLVDQALALFGRPEALWADIAAQRPGAQTDDYFQAVLRYDRLRVVLRASMLAADPGPRLAVYGTRGSYTKRGLDPQEDALKAGRYPPAADWGRDERDGELTLWRDGGPHTSRLPTLPGDYPAYYAGLRDAILGRGPAPVTAAEGVAVMELIALGLRSSAERREQAVG